MPRDLSDKNDGGCFELATSKIYLQNHVIPEAYF